MRGTAAVTTVLLLVVGCRPEHESSCRPGFTIAQDGHCYPPPPDPRPPSANDVLENVGPCVPKKPGSEIDLLLACLDGACAGDTFEVVNEILGEGLSCEDLGADWFCTWPQSVQALFPIGEYDVASPAPEAVTPWIRATVGYAGTNVDGLGIAVSPRCYVDVLGGPTTAEFVDTFGQLEPRQLIWDEYGIEIEDEQEPGGVDLPDGEVDELTLSGPS